MHFRKAESNDFEAVYQLINELEDKILPKEKQQAIFEKNSKHPQIIYLVAEDQDAVVGFMGTHIQDLLHHGGKVAEIQEFIMNKSYRSTGLGSLFLKELFQRLNELEIYEVEVTSNKLRERAHQFYIKENFKDSHKKFTIKLI